MWKFAIGYWSKQGLFLDQADFRKPAVDSELLQLSIGAKSVFYNQIFVPSELYRR
jgi:hypothetical protein